MALFVIPPKGCTRLKNLEGPFMGWRCLREETPSGEVESSLYIQEEWRSGNSKA